MMPTSRRRVFTIAGVLIAVGILLGLVPVTAGPSKSNPTNCGSAFFGNYADAEREDHIDELIGWRGESVDACDKARSERKVPAYGALGLGILILAGGYAMSARQD